MASVPPGCIVTPLVLAPPNSKSLPSLLTIVPFAVPPEETSSRPRKPTDRGLRRHHSPNSLTNVPLATPLEPTNCEAVSLSKLRKPLSVVCAAVPAEVMICVPPLLTSTPVFTP